MTIFHTMNSAEDIDFFLSKPNLNSNIANFDNRCCHECFDIFGNNMPYIYKKQIAPISNFWIHFDLMSPVINSSTRRLLTLSDQLAGVDVITVSLKNNIITIAGSSTIKTIDCTTYNLNGNLTTFDFQIALSVGNIDISAFYVENSTTGGQVNVGPTLTSIEPESTTINNLSIGSDSTNNTVSNYISQVILSDDDTRDLKVVHLLPKTNGINTDWDNDKDYVNDLDTLNVYHSVSSGTIGDKISFMYDNTHGDFAASTVKSVKQTFAGVSEFMTLLDVSLIQIENNIEYNVSSTTSAGIGIINTDSYESTTDNLGNDWTITSLNNLEAGLKTR